MNEIREANTDKISYDVALEEFDRWAAAWRIDTDIDSMNQEDADDFEALKRKITLQISAGEAWVNDNDNIVYKLFEPIGTLSEIELKRPRGRAWRMTDQAKLNRNVAKNDLLIAQAIGQTPTILSRLDGIDYKYIIAVYSLFLGS
jgi:hypothetical protein